MLFNTKANTSVHSKPKQVFYYFDDYFKNMNKFINNDSNSFLMDVFIL